MTTFAFLLHYNQQVKENARRQKSQPFKPNLKSGNPSLLLYFAHLKQVMKSRNTVGEETAQGRGTRRWVSLGANSEAAYIEQRSILSSHATTIAFGGKGPLPPSQQSRRGRYRCRWR